MVNEGLKTLGFLRGPDGRDFAAARRGAGQLARLALELDLAGIGAHARRCRRVDLAKFTWRIQPRISDFALAQVVLVAVMWVQNPPEREPEQLSATSLLSSTRIRATMRWKRV
jgi:hypothetical protein